jgi:uncharacterized protein YdaU (DUF1376 family)
MHYYTREAKDYIASASHLTLIEHGAYVRLMDVYMTTESPIKASEAIRVSGAKTKPEQEAVKSVLSEFFVLNNGFWTNEKLDRQITDYRKKAAANRNNGRFGGRPKVVKFDGGKKPSGF